MGRAMDITREERELLTLLRARPAVYLGGYAGLRELQEFLRGYEVALMRHALTDVRLLPEGFQGFVEERFGIPLGSQMGWWTIISRQEPDNYKAMELFWDLLNEYLHELHCEEIPRPAVPAEERTMESGIRPVRYGDLARLAASYMYTFNGAPWLDEWTVETAMQRLTELYHAPHFYGIAVFRNGEPIGALLGRSEHYFDRKAFQIVELWIEPEAQRQGIGQALLDTLKADKPEERLYLITMKTDQTEGFYEKNGFVVQDGLCVMQMP